MRFPPGLWVVLPLAIATSVCGSNVTILLRLAVELAKNKQVNMVRARLGCERTTLEAKWELLVRVFTYLEHIESRKCLNLNSISRAKDKPCIFSGLEALTLTSH